MRRIWLSSSGSILSNGRLTDLSSRTLVGKIWKWLGHILWVVNPGSWLSPPPPPTKRYVSIRISIDAGRILSGNRLGQAPCSGPRTNSLQEDGGGIFPFYLKGNFYFGDPDLPISLNLIFRHRIDDEIKLEGPLASILHSSGRAGSIDNLIN